MGILPLQFAAGETADSLGLSGEEVFEVSGVKVGIAAKRVTVNARAADGTVKTFTATVRIDTPQEAEYYRHGGILEYVLRDLAK
jgi:aconitate hydratase